MAESTRTQNQDLSIGRGADMTDPTVQALLYDQATGEINYELDALDLTIDRLSTLQLIEQRFQTLVIAHKP